MRYYLDHEFAENGRTIALISIGLVSDDGRELYCVSEEFDDNQCNKWVVENVIPQLPTRDAIDDQGRPVWCSRHEIGRRIIQFIGRDPAPEFWAYFAAYDWVVFCQIFGTMNDLPSGFPMYCNDLKQLAVSLGVRDSVKTIVPQHKGEHDALEDAHWNKNAHRVLMELDAKRRGLV